MAARRLLFQEDDFNSNVEETKEADDDDDDDEPYRCYVQWGQFATGRDRIVTCVGNGTANSLQKPKAASMFFCGKCD